VQALSQALITCKRARRGLSEEKRELIAGLLWLEVTAARAAEFFRTIRERIAAECEAELDSIVYSDGWKAYNKLSLNGFQHRRINHDKTLVDGKVPISDFRGYAKRRLKPTSAASSAASGSLSGSDRLPKKHPDWSMILWDTYCYYST
jgi:transposase-like protein